jgi:hypothetical protein
MFVLFWIRSYWIAVLEEEWKKPSYHCQLLKGIGQWLGGRIDKIK